MAGKVRSESHAEYLANNQLDDDSIITLALAIIDSRITRGEALTNPDDAGRVFKLRLQRSEREVFACLFLDTRHRILAYEELFFGSIDSAEIRPREVAKRALALNAAAVMFAHNHPSGVAEPSMADRNITSKLIDALQLIEVRVLDHFIIRDGAPCSMARLGMI